jgi:hypothetical protein
MFCGLLRHRLFSFVGGYAIYLTCNSATGLTLEVAACQKYEGRIRQETERAYNKIDDEESTAARA